MFRREVWLINLDPSVGAEIRKTRPAVIVSSDAIGVLPLRVVVPLTDWKSHYQQAAWMIRITPNEQNGLTKDSAADSFQIRSVSRRGLFEKLVKYSRMTWIKSSMQSDWWLNICPHIELVG